MIQDELRFLIMTLSSCRTCNGRFCTARRRSGGTKPNPLLKHYRRQLITVPQKVSVLTIISRQYPRLQIDVFQFAVNAENALQLLRPYDVILDCTDNAPSRYLLSDASVLLNKPLVSGAAQRFDGQLCVYNLGTSGPCYRCLFPMPPTPKLTGSCEEMGILGVVTGIIGNLQALETIKILAGLHGE